MTLIQSLKGGIMRRITGQGCLVGVHVVMAEVPDFADCAVGYVLVPILGTRRKRHTPSPQLVMYYEDEDDTDYRMLYLRDLDTLDRSRTLGSEESGVVIRLTDPTDADESSTFRVLDTRQAVTKCVSTPLKTMVT